MLQPSPLASAGLVTGSFAAARFAVDPDTVFSSSGLTETAIDIDPGVSPASLTSITELISPRVRYFLTAIDGKKADMAFRDKPASFSTRDEPGAFSSSDADVNNLRFSDAPVTFAGKGQKVLVFE